MQEHTQAGVKVETASVQLSLVSRPKFVQHTKPRESTEREREREDRRESGVSYRSQANKGIGPATPEAYFKVYDLLLCPWHVL